MSSVIERGRSHISERSDCGGRKSTATAFMEMLIGSGCLGGSPQRVRPGRASCARPAGPPTSSSRLAYPPESLAELSVEFPVQVYTGGRSHPGLQKLARRLAELIPRAGLIEVPPATHAVQQFTEHFHPALLAVTAGGGRV